MNTDLPLHLKFIEQYVRKSVPNETAFKLAFDLEMALYKVIGITYRLVLKSPTYEFHEIFQAFQIMRQNLAKVNPMFNLSNFVDDYLEHQEVDITYSDIRQYWIFDILRAYLEDYLDTYKDFSLGSQKCCTDLIGNFPDMLEKAIFIVEALTIEYIERNDLKIQYDVQITGANTEEFLKQMLDDFYKM